MKPRIRQRPGIEMWVCYRWWPGDRPGYGPTPDLAYRAWRALQVRCRT